VNDFEAVRADLEGVEGWLTDAQAQALFDAAEHVPRGGRIVEIGSFRGRSTIVLARGAGDGVELVAIDPHGGSDRGPQEIAPDRARGEQDFEAFHENLRRAGVEQRVRHVRAFSSEALGAVPGEIDLLFVDGAHRYRPAREDIERWGARVAPGGTMLIHDAYNAIGVMLAQLRVLVPSAVWAYQGRRGSLAEYRRVAAMRAPAGARNAARQLSGLPYFARNLLVKMCLVAGQPRLARALGHREGEWPH
jgi:predicted O-methyltransferase YrrM